MFNDLLAMGAGGGTTPVEMIMFCDCSTPNAMVIQTYNTNILEVTSGAFRTASTGTSNITFTSNISGDMKWSYANNSTTAYLEVNGTNVLGGTQPIHINVGDTIRWYTTPHYTGICVWLETEV